MERDDRERYDDRVGEMTRQWYFQRYGVDETPIKEEVNQQPETQPVIKIDGIIKPVKGPHVPY